MSIGITVIHIVFLPVDALLLVILYSMQRNSFKKQQTYDRISTKKVRSPTEAKVRTCLVKGMQIQGNMVLKVTLVTGMAGIWVWMFPKIVVPPNHPF